MASLPYEAAIIIGAVRSKRESVKTAVYKSKYSNKKQLMAVICEVLKYYDVLCEIAKSTEISKEDKRLMNNEALTVIILYEYLFKKGLKGTFAKFKKTFENRKSSIHSAVERIKIRYKITNLADIYKEDRKVLPRYVRINTIIISLDAALAHLKTEGYQLSDNADGPLQGSSFRIDEDIPNVLIFPSRTDFHEHSLCLGGSLILQDKASCLPSYILNPEPGAHVIDACAAPGNKTTHLAAIMNNCGQITAFELNSKRCITLRTMLSKAKVTCCHVVNGDFIKCDTNKYKQVEYILVDPSCSGSGIADRLDEFTNDQQSSSADRLRNLSAFQCTILKKALSFPNVKRVVYSTCSIHQEENEQVVSSVLELYKEKFTLEDIMPSWRERGRDLDGTFPYGKRCLRSSPESTNTIGFFVASFIRIIKTTV